jgi:hypothetical protein
MKRGSGSDPYQSEKPDPDLHQSIKSGAVEAQIKPRSLTLEPLSRTVEEWRLTMELWRVCRPIRITLTRIRIRIKVYKVRCGYTTLASGVNIFHSWTFKKS